MFYLGTSIALTIANSLLYLLLEDSDEQCAAAMDTAMLSHSCTSEVGAAVGVMIVVVCLVAIVITIIVLLCLRR